MIKFRAWDKVQKVMMVPRDIQTDSDGNIFYVEAMGPDGEYDEGGLDVFKLEQFTGLTDVNGKDIYENDIIVSEPTEPILGSPKIGVVKLSKVSFSWCFVTGNIEYNIWKTDRYRTYEVIGNVHANPELLEEEK